MVYGGEIVMDITYLYVAAVLAGNISAAA